MIIIVECARCGFEFGEDLDMDEAPECPQCHLKGATIIHLVTGGSGNFKERK